MKNDKLLQHMIDDALFKMWEIELYTQLYGEDESSASLHKKYADKYRLLTLGLEDEQKRLDNEHLWSVEPTEAQEDE